MLSEYNALVCTFLDQVMICITYQKEAKLGVDKSYIVLRTLTRWTIEDYHRLSWASIRKGRINAIRP